MAETTLGAPCRVRKLAADSRRDSRCHARAVRIVTGQQSNVPTLRATRGDTKSVPVGIYQIALPTSESRFIDWNPELRRYGVDVLDIEMDQGVRPCVALVLR